MRRRDFIKGVAGSAVTWPLVAHAQQEARMRRVGVLMNMAADDQQGQQGIAAFLEALQLFGWSDGRNVRIDVRWGVNNLDRQTKYATELAALGPEVILASGTVSVAAVQHVSRILPIVFVRVVDPVGAGFVQNLARPGGSVTGFMLFEYSLSAKWLELLKQVAPHVTRAVVLRDPTNPSGSAQYGVIQAVSQLLGVEVNPVNDSDAGEIERAIATFAHSPNGGLIATGTAISSPHRDLIVKLAEQYRLPAVYADRLNGGLICYGPDRVNPFRLAAGYIDRILKGEKAADLPVQAPTRYKLVVNLKTAKALGLTVPLSLLTSADEVIE